MNFDLTTAIGIAGGLSGFLIVLINARVSALQAQVNHLMAKVTRLEETERKLTAENTEHLTKRIEVLEENRDLRKERDTLLVRISGQKPLAA